MRRLSVTTTAVGGLGVLRHDNIADVALLIPCQVLPAHSPSQAGPQRFWRAAGWGAPSTTVNSPHPPPTLMGYAQFCSGHTACAGGGGRGRSTAQASLSLLHFQKVVILPAHTTELGWAFSLPPTVQPDPVYGWTDHWPFSSWFKEVEHH